jgi:hypothetical protein
MSELTLAAILMRRTRLWRSPMRMFVLILAALTAVKLWHRDETYRAAADQAVVAAYLAQASAACQKIRQVANDGSALSPFPINWATPERSRLSAGNTLLSVRFWQVDNVQWTSRFKAPHLVLESGEQTGGVACAYDLSGGQATIGRI